MIFFNHPLTVNEFLKKTYNPSEEIGKYLGIETVWFVRPAAICKDGYFVSIQASCGAYCSPGITTNAVDYQSVELGYPSSSDEELLDYAEEPDDPLYSVYGYVPMSVVEKVIEKHGGIVSAEELHILRG